MAKIIGVGIVALAALGGLALAMLAEFENDMTRYALMLGAGLLIGTLVGIIRDRGNRPTIEG